MSSKTEPTATAALVKYSNCVQKLQASKSEVQKYKDLIEQYLANNRKNEEIKTLLENYKTASKEMRDALIKERKCLRKYRRAFVNTLKEQMIGQDLTKGDIIPDNVEKFSYLGLQTNAEKWKDISSKIEWKDIPTNKVPIGSGTFGTVYKGICHGTEVAIKILKKSVNIEDVSFQSEVKLLSGLVHENVLRFMGVSIDDVNKQPAIVTEYVSRKSLDIILHHKETTDETQTVPSKDFKFTFRRKMFIASEIAKGMNYLHQNSVYHLDLKTANILVDEDWHIRIADFGLSKVIGPDGIVRSVGGTPVYMAPELFKKITATADCDVYSFGVVLWELIFEKDPFKTIEAIWEHQQKSLVKATFEEFGVWINTDTNVLPLNLTLDPDPELQRIGPSNKLLDILNGCLAKTPGTRRPKNGFAEMEDEIYWTDIAKIDSSNGSIRATRLWQQFNKDKKPVKTVKWNKFIKGFLQHLNGSVWKYKNPEDHYFKHVKALRAHLDVDNSPDSESVTEEAWKRYITWFPLSLQNDNDLIAAYNLASQRWWFGFINQQEARNILILAPAGSFLIRFSSQQEKFTISWVYDVKSEKEKTVFKRIFHRRFALDPDDPVNQVGSVHIFEADPKIKDKLKKRNRDQDKKIVFAPYSLYDAVSWIKKNTKLFTDGPIHPCPLRPAIYQKATKSVKDDEDYVDDGCYGAVMGNKIDDTKDGKKQEEVDAKKADSETIDPTWIPYTGNSKYYVID